MKKTILSLVLYLHLTVSFGQDSSESNFVLWSSTRKLTANDFMIRTNSPGASTSFAQFSLECWVNGFDFLTNNFNRKVRNQFIKSASWLHTAADVPANLKYQQTLFDICEIYARQFRKDLKENRWKIALGPQTAEELNQKWITDFSVRRLQYEIETNSGTFTQKQQEWEAIIAKELQELSEYSNDQFESF